MPNFVFTAQSGGPITVNAIHRSYRQIAPDSVRFEVDLSSSTFDTDGPTGGEVYDARLHDLIYLWDLDDPGTWTAPENVLTAWKNRSVAQGPSVRHLYRQPGTYTVSVLVIEPSTGKNATAEVTFDVDDPQDFYGDANTIYINNVGDSDFSDVPAGVPSGNKINVDSFRKVFDGTFQTDSVWSSFEGGSAKRWRFKRGGSWEISIFLNSDDTQDVMFDDYGDPEDPDPIWNIHTSPETAELFILRMGYNHENQGGRDKEDRPPELRMRNINSQGHFDSTASRATDPASERSAFCWFISSSETIMADCRFDGFGNTVMNFQNSTGSDYTAIGKLHMDNCTLSNFGGEYPVIVSNSATVDSSVAFTGVKWEQPGDAVSSGAFMGSRSSARMGSPNFTHMRGCDSFITEADLTHFQILKGAQNDGYLVNIHSCSAEGGSAFFDTDGAYYNTPQDRSHAHNIIVDGLIYVGGWSAISMFQIASTGITIRNCLYIVPAVERINNGTQGFLRIVEYNDSGSALPAAVADAPIRFFNCTYLVLRTALQNSPSGTQVPSMISTEGLYPNFTNVSQENNILHMPNLSVDGNPNAPDTTFAPLSSNVLWSPRMLGRRDPSTLVLDTDYATPAGTIADTKPLSGSVALNGATGGNRAFLDITGSSRYGTGVYNEGTVDDGAWQVS